MSVRGASNASQENQIPTEFIGPLSLTLLRYPRTCSPCAHIFEKTWLKQATRKENKCPLCRREIEVYSKAKTLKKKIKKWGESHPDLYKKAKRDYTPPPVVNKKRKRKPENKMNIKEFSALDSEMRNEVCEDSESLSYGESDREAYEIAKIVQMYFETQVV